MCGPDIEAPEPRDLAKETSDTLETQIRLAPDIFAAESNPNYGQPAYIRLGLQNLETALFGTPAAGASSGGTQTSTVTRPAEPVAEDSDEFQDAYQQNLQQLLLDEPSNIRASRTRRQRPSSFANARNEALQMTRDQFAQPITETITEAGGEGAPEGGGTPGYLDLMARALPAVEEMQIGVNRQRREADIADVEMFGARAVEAIKAANPEQQRLLDLLNETAATELEAGAGLTAEEQARADEDIRSAFSGLGRTGSGAAITSEILNRYGLGRQRLQERVAMGLDVARANAGTSVDPMLAITGRSSMANAPAAQAFASGQSMETGPGYFDPFSNAYSADLYNTNYNAESATNIANANNDAGILGGLIAAGGLIGAAKLSDRRAKTETKRIGIDSRGFGLWRFRYHSDPPGTVRTGVMAQEVRSVIPAAVTEIRGLLHVDYSQLGIEPTLQPA